MRLRLALIIGSVTTDTILFSGMFFPPLGLLVGVVFGVLFFGISVLWFACLVPWVSWGARFTQSLTKALRDTQERFGRAKWQTIRTTVAVITVLTIQGLYFLYVAVQETG